jgi:hypothetical protein
MMQGLFMRMEASIAIVVDIMSKLNVVECPVMREATVK